MSIQDEIKKEKIRMNKKRRRKGRIVALVILFICLFIIGFSGGAFFYVFGGLNTTDMPDDNDSLGISSEADQANTGGVTNIALFGVDTRGNDDSGRSDAIMILSVNNDAAEINMVSILRDSKVAIEGHGVTKINHAYAYGGAPLAVKTLNQNFDLDIKNYVTVNFNQLSQIVDAVGGVYLTLTDAEVQSANHNMEDSFPSEPRISGSGEMLLTGPQAVSFARIRNIDSDNARADRQQQVLKAIFTKIQTMSKADYPSFIREFLKITETSLGFGDLLSLSPIMLKGNLSFNQYVVPDEHENPWGGTDTDGVWYWKYDLDAAAQRIHSIIYNN